MLQIIFFLNPSRKKSIKIPEIIKSNQGRLEQIPAYFNYS